MGKSWMGRTGTAAEALRIAQIWAHYKKHNDASSRERLAEYYLSLVTMHAESYRLRLPATVDIDDLISAGSFGLLDAIESYDIDRGVKFETFSNVRIKGAMRDYLRTMDWAPRLARQRRKQFDQIVRELELNTGQMPTMKEVRMHMGVDQKEFERIYQDATTPNMVSIHNERSEGQTYRGSVADLVVDNCQKNPCDIVMHHDVREWVTKRLSTVERMIVLLYYYESMTMQEIGKTLQLSESRVSQLHAIIKSRLRTEIKDREVELECLAA